MLVLDASAAVDFLVRVADRGIWVEDRLGGISEVSAPALLDIEVASALRGLVRGRVVTARRAEQALDDLADFRVTRYPHGALLPRVWRLRNAMSAYDAAYVALAKALDVPLVTTDARLARAGGHGAARACPF
jgi:predicted nucleic acid-binding protein